MNIDLIAMIPDLALLGLALLILASDLGASEGRKAFHITWIGLLALILLMVMLPPNMRDGTFGGYHNSSAGLLWKILFTLAALGTTWLARPYFEKGGNSRGILIRPGAFFGLLVLCVQGMFAIVSARDLLTFYLGLELATLPLYALAAFQPHDSDSVEAGSKYVLMGGFSSALSLFGLSFLYGSAGSLSFDALTSAVQMDASQPLLLGGTLFLLGGLGFKLAMAPLQMWAPDVYQGAPTPVMAFLSVGSKAAAVAATVVIFFGPLDGLRPLCVGVISGAAVLSMVVGNLGAMRQSNLRRFVAYSSIAQVGYMLLAFLGDVESARVALQYNLLVYGVTSFGLYFIMSIVGKESLETISSLRGLNQRHPGLAILLLLCMFSLAGIPPLAGFLGKFLLFSTAAAQGYYVLISIAVLNAVVSFYYYMLIVKEAYIVEADRVPSSIQLNGRQKFVLGTLSIALLVLGLCPFAMDWLAARGGP